MQTQLTTYTDRIGAQLAGQRFVDNGDGTVTDVETGLMWEQKDGTVGSPVDCSTTTCSDPRDVNNLYMWSSSGLAPDGIAFTEFLGALNGAITGACFANHCDWRLPTIEELGGIVDVTVAGCGSGSPCIDAVFGPTRFNVYWSATTDSSGSDRAWGVDFYRGLAGAGGKTFRNYVRAVRGGL